MEILIPLLVIIGSLFIALIVYMFKLGAVQRPTKKSGSTEYRSYTPYRPSDYDEFYSIWHGKRYTYAEYTYWKKALSYIYEYAKSGEYQYAYEFVNNILNDKDNKKYALELYHLIDHTIINLYPLRDIGECADMLISLGLHGISLIDDYILQAKGECVWRYPTKLLILLERKGQLDEAIELCTFLAERNVRDTGYATFYARRNKLIDKKERGV